MAGFMMPMNPMGNLQQMGALPSMALQPLNPFMGMAPMAYSNMGGLGGMNGMNGMTAPMGMNSMMGMGMNPSGMMGQMGMQGEMMQLMSLLMSMLMGMMAGNMMGQGMGQQNGLFGGMGPVGPGGGHCRPRPNGGGQSHGPNGPAVNPQNLGATPLARSIVGDALRNTNSQQGLCLKNVGAVLRRNGVNVGPAHAAHMVDGQCANSDKLREVRVGRDQLGKLPAGAVVVWEKGQGLPYGHISIALGDGREWSGPIRKQMNLSTSYRVFIPR